MNTAAIRSNRHKLLILAALTEAYVTPLAAGLFL